MLLMLEELMTRVKVIEYVDIVVELLSNCFLVLLFANWIRC